MSLDFIFSILILIFSVVAHEVAHGYSAYLQGDNTAKYAGRLTLNPIKHLEWFGSFILPVMSYLLGGFLIGWAKPVPFNPYNLRNQRWGEALVAIAGPVTNIFIALIFGLFLRFGASSASEALIHISALIVLMNLVLATFNMVPIPPLDGSKILFSILPDSLYHIRESLEQYGTTILIFFIFFLWQYLLPIISLEFQFITGLML
jgi:Zn-dependent protease